MATFCGMTREERQALAAEDRADGEDFDEECDRRYSGATCACGFELYGCPFHDPVQVLPARHVTFAASYDDEECDRRYSNATCACGFESYGCPFHDPVAPLSPQSWATLRAGLESARSEPLGYLERLRRHDAHGRTAYGFDAYDDEGYSCDDFTDARLPPAPSVTDGMMRAAFMAWRP